MTKAQDRSGDERSPIARGGGLAVWRQIAERLAADIAAGLHPPGSRLPTEEALARRFGVNRHTLRRSIRALTEEGVLRPVQGSGTFVSSKPIPYPIGPRTRFSEIVGRAHRAPSGRLLRWAELPAEGEVAEALKLRAGQAVLRVDTLRLADEVPICIGTSWYPAGRFPRFIEVFERSGSITCALEAHGVGDYRRASTRVSARLADARDSALLSDPYGRVILVIDSVNVDCEGKPIELGHTRFAADRVEIELQS